MPVATLTQFAASDIEALLDAFAYSELTSGNATTATTENTGATLTFEIFGSGFTYDGTSTFNDGENVTSGTITRLDIYSGSTLLLRITDLSISATALAAAFEDVQTSDDFTAYDALIDAYTINYDGTNVPSGAEVSVPGSEENDTYTLGAGDYYISPGDGADTITAGTSSYYAQINYSNESGGGITVNWAAGNITDPYGETDTFTGRIDSIRGTSSADSITGDSSNNSIRGLAGNDFFDGGDGFDEVRYDRDANYGGTSGVTVNLATGTATDGFGDTDTLVSVERVRGSNLADTITGNDANNRLLGLGGNDIIDGGAGNDELDGGEGNDTIATGSGFDTVIGSIGNDSIDTTSATDVFVDYSGLSEAISVQVNTTTATVNKGSNGTDTITNIDDIDYVNGGLGFLGTANGDSFAINGPSDQWVGVVGGSGDDTITNTGSGNVRADYRSDGASSGSGITYTSNNGTRVSGTVTGAGTGTDTLSGVNEIRGTDFNDTFNGGDGNERFILRGGNDTVDGGGGTDTVRFDRSGMGAVAVDLISGTATGTFNGNAFSHTLENVEQIRGSSNGDELSGSDADERFEGKGGNDSLSGLGGNDVLFGDDGNDILDGGAGADALDGGSGNDWADYRSSDAAVNVILAGSGTQSGGDAEGDTLTGIENLFGSIYNDVLSGNGLANYIRGGHGNDTLNSGSGDDQLRGDAGNDVLIGGAGADILDGGSGNDWADYRSSNAGVTVALIGSGAQSGGHAEGDTLTGIENLFGSSHNDVLSGNGLDNYIRGGDGNDTLNTGSGDDHLRGDNGNDVLIGGAGADILDGGAGNDWADYRGSNAGVNVALVGSGAQSGGHAEGDTLSGIENLFGSSHNDVLSGNGLDNYIRGGDGNDTLNSGSGDDTLRGDDGNDVLIGGAGADILNGGAGSDWADYRASNVGVTVTLVGSGAQSGGHAEGDTLTNIENLFGSAHNDALTGNGLANYLRGGAGNDVLKGGNGTDTLRGDAGNDVLLGGSDSDTFFFAAFHGSDTVLDFEDGSDTIFIASGASSFADLVITADGGDTLIDFTGTTVRLNGINTALITEDDFSFT
ncbi:beta strand repeat-containing protein [Roseibium sp. M-1]